jgi:hypothetical protein
MCVSTVSPVKNRKIFWVWKVGGWFWYVTGGVGVRDGKAMENDSFWDVFFR